MSISLERYLPFLNQLPGAGNYLAEAMKILEDGVNSLGNHIAADPSGNMPTPSTPQGLTVKTNGTGLVHAVINDETTIQKNLQYFVEYSNSPSFNQPHVIHLGASRTMSPITLPGKDDNGNPQAFYFRTYSQYPGSKPSAPIYFGGDAPSAVNPGGTQQMTLLSSTGSGTASNNGQQGGSGLGKVLYRK